MSGEMEGLYADSKKGERRQSPRSNECRELTGSSKETCQQPGEVDQQRSR